MTVTKEKKEFKRFRVIYTSTRDGKQYVDDYIAMGYSLDELLSFMCPSVRKRVLDIEEIKAQKGYKIGSEKNNPSYKRGLMNGLETHRVIR